MIMHEDFEENLEYWAMLTNQNAHTEAIISIAAYFFEKVWDNRLCELLAWFCNFRINHYGKGGLTIEEFEERTHKADELIDIIAQHYGKENAELVNSCL